MCHSISDLPTCTVPSTHYRAHRTSECGWCLAPHEPVDIDRWNVRHSRRASWPSISSIVARRSIHDAAANVRPTVQGRAAFDALDLRLHYVPSPLPGVFTMHVLIYAITPGQRVPIDSCRSGLENEHARPHECSKSTSGGTQCSTLIAAGWDT